MYNLQKHIFLNLDLNLFFSHEVLWFHRPPISFDHNKHLGFLIFYNQVITYLWKHLFQLIPPPLVYENKFDN